MGGGGFVRVFSSQEQCGVRCHSAVGGVSLGECVLRGAAPAPASGAVHDVPPVGTGGENAG